MKSLRKGALAAVLMIACLASLALAQGPVNKRVNYTINVEYKLRMGDYMLSPGRYVLYQVSYYEPNLFALYPNDMRRSPVAMIRTTRVEYQGTDYPSKTKMMLDVDESGNVGQPVIRGWTIPGEDGWEIISVVAKDDHYLTRAK